MKDWWKTALMCSLYMLALARVKCHGYSRDDVSPF